MNQRQRKRAAEGVPRGGVPDFVPCSICDGDATHITVTGEPLCVSCAGDVKVAGITVYPVPPPDMPPTALEQFWQLRDNLDELGHELTKSAPGRAFVRAVVWLNDRLERRRQRRMQRRKGQTDG